MKKNFIISGVNLTEGGTLTVFRDCLRHAVQYLDNDEWNIIAIVHDSELFDLPSIEYIEMPEIKASWLKRLKFEYYDCRTLSKELNADFWLSMHDMSSCVGDVPQAVYCHNPMWFYKMPLKQVLSEPKLFLFSKLYSSLYGLNIQANKVVVVQQEWIRKAFEEKFNHNNIAVAHPVVNDTSECSCVKTSGNRFIFPTLSRSFKNIEVLLNAWKLLLKDPSWAGSLVVTIDGTENAYATSLVKKFGNLKGVEFTGRISYSEVQHYFTQSDCLVFPSKLETWGLPLSEAKKHGLAILAADLPYAHETSGKYNGVSFFSPDDSQSLADNMKKFSVGDLKLDETKATKYKEPFAKNWNVFFELLLK